MSGIVCLSVLVVVYLGFGWPGVLCVAAALLVTMWVIARYQLDREDAGLIRRARR